MLIILGEIYCGCPGCKRLARREIGHRKNSPYKEPRPHDDKVLAKTHGLCWYCGRKLISNKRINDISLTKRQKAAMFTMDHIIPQSKGGTNALSNLVPCCNACNNLRGNGGIDFLRMKLLFKKQGWHDFNIHQFNFLISKDIELHSIEEYIFYFETMKEQKDDSRKN